MQAVGSTLPGVVSKWLVTQGQFVQYQQDLVELHNNERGSLVVTAPFAGRVHRLNYPVGVVYPGDNKKMPLLYLQIEMVLPVEQQEQKPKVKHETVHVTDEYWRWLLSYVEEISTEWNYARSEVVRASLEHFRSLAPADRLRVLERNRKKEVAGHYGSGVHPSRRSPRKKRA